MIYPKISVVIPTHNRPKLLLRAVKSVLSQTFEDFEIIVVDDGREKNIEKNNQIFDDSRVRYFKTEGNTGAPSARNLGIVNARAPIIAFLDDDDEFLSGKLQRVYKVLQKNPKCGFVFSATKEFFEEKDCEEIRGPQLKEGVYNFWEAFIATYTRTVTSALVVRKTVLSKVGGFNEQFLYNDDGDIMFRLSKHQCGYFIPEPLVLRHIPKEEHIGGDPMRRIQGRELLIKEYWDDLRIRPRALKQHYLGLAYFYNQAGQHRCAGLYLLKAWWLNTSDIKLFLRAIGRVFFGPYVSR